MPKLALLLVALSFFLIFVLRTALQWWQTGSTGVKGFTGRVGSLEWNAGLLVSLGLLLAGIAPLATLNHWPGGALFFYSPAIHLGGAALATVGMCGALYAQVAMGNSWRIGVDATERTELITSGIYSRVRNPIFSFMIVLGLGLLLLVPTSVSLLAVAFTAAGIEIQVRAVEEPYLRRAHGATYEAYCARVGRFIPGVGRKITALGHIT
jgi:protein-S-isoprenylcysteine O-methyltransferase Ste14